MPTLQAPEDTDLSSFADWRTDYVALTRVMDDVRTPTACQGLLRPAVHQEWTVLWQTGRLDVAPDDDIDGIVEKIGRYLHLHRNPLLDHKDFSGRNKRKTTTLTSTSHLSSALTRDARTRTTFRPAALNVDTKGITHGGRLKERRFRDRLIFGLRDPGMQRKVLLEDFGQNLTLDRVLQIGLAHESSKDTGLALAQESPAHFLAARRSAYKKATSEPPDPSPCG